MEKLIEVPVKGSPWKNVALWTVVAGGLAWVVSRQLKYKEIIQTEAHKVDSQTRASKQKRKVKILFGSQTGKGQSFSRLLQRKINSLGYEATVIDLASYDHESNFLPEAGEGNICIIVISTYTDGQPPDPAHWFYTWLKDLAEDFRVTKSTLSGLHFTVVGLGNSLYGEHFNMVAKKVDDWLHTLSANRILTPCLADENVIKSEHKGLQEDLEAWLESSLSNLKRAIEGRKVTAKACESTCKKQCGCKTKKDGVEDGGGGKCSSDGDSNDDDDNHEDFFSDEDNEEEPNFGETTTDVMDLEDLGKVMHQAAQAKRLNGASKSGDGPRDMITPLLKESLEKQGYKLIGSHSGVKLCRWTKSMLRGRGGCYKHTFYGIESHRCMETTPSLACANKCVFCWRHHTNPVGTEWKWTMDEPQVIFDGALNNHTKLIKQFRGVPGVKPQRFEEAMTPQHCALSLVGEPIMYPQINQFIRLLHDKHISSFLVTNAQFPQEIRDLLPVTQLYVSVDAATKDSLKKIDRPLFKDFWQRFIDSLTALRDKGQRTVYRLTLVKAWNTEELDNYAKLVSLGNPDFIEVKGVTYCGESKASNLTMKNVPWHEEVVKFVQELQSRLPDYELASEHEHSNCLLLAHHKFKRDGHWWTWIDYPKFHQLWQRYDETGGKEAFGSEDYMAPTPHWAVFGAAEQGFDPAETRFYRNKKS
ncbi:S-adenosyl-l-methionine-dependent tRNA 4-demethylwyosine synthase [Plakobranchus ocellatus]|uniref:S-adenosyl-L-methionine-dependent tRNA 4-demethylwyosine synthase TYW1 n=1 Tax=Plakobranchus ocellatus TaxID=259542 RepID=A0AAV4DAU5_9GAST|nr:S-adenosyl-l-methionine-dependent tRNA 4-demethylwyosine synthase [Plakobranchus ocellatus]